MTVKCLSARAVSRIMFKDAIKFFPLFEDASDEEIEHVAKYFEKRSVAKGETLYREGDKADRMYFVYTGQVVLTSEDDNGLIMELTRIDDTGALFGKTSRHWNEFDVEQVSNPIT